VGRQHQVGAERLLGLVVERIKEIHTIGISLVGKVGKEAILYKVPELVLGNLK